MFFKDFEPALIQPINNYLKRKAKKDYVEIEYNREQQAIESFEQWSENILKGLNWNNLLVVGGSILGSIRYSNEKGIDLRETFRRSPDIDIYIYGLSPEDANKKVTFNFKN